MGPHSNGRKVSPERQAWANMIQRCYYPRDKKFSCYGGRGIKVCDRWRDSYEAFVVDMGLRPSPKHSLDRIDTNGDYSQANCRWLLMSEQQWNKRNNVKATIGGQEVLVAKAALEAGIDPATAYQRRAAGWSDEQLLMGGDEHRQLVLTDKRVSSADLCDLSTLHGRVRWARKQAGMNYLQAAQAAGVSGAWVRLVERTSKTSNPRVKTLLAYAQACGVPLSWLMTGQGEPTLRQVAVGAGEATVGS